jgi:hypothetical protein
MKNKLSFFTLSLFLLASCSKAPGDKPITPEEKINPYFTGIDLSNTARIDWETRDLTDKYYMLGYGYDITGKYAHPASTRNKVIDIEEFEQDGGTIFSSFTSSGGPELDISGTRETCIQSMGKRAGLSEEELSKYKNIFRETFESPFKSDTTFRSIDYKYEGISQVAVYAAFGIFEMDFDKFQAKYLTPEFKKDLETKTAAEIITLYGTHVLKKIDIGQRMDYFYRHNDEYDARKWLIPTIRKYFSPAPSVWKETPQEEAPLKQNLSVELIGGNRLTTNSWMFDVTNYTGNKIVYQEWNNMSIKDHTLINFSRNDGVVPIYEFVKDATKKEAIIKAYNAYLGL